MRKLMGIQSVVHVGLSIALVTTLLLSAEGAAAAVNPLTWTVKAPMPTARFGLSAAAVSGKVYAIGGYNAMPLNTVEAYNPKTETWETVAPMPTPRYGAGATASGDKIYVIGGYGANNQHLNAVEAYDPKTNTWETMAPMPTERASLATTLGGDGKIYAMGGDHMYNLPHSLVEAYDPVSNTWETKPHMFTYRSGLAAAGLGGKVYAIGGFQAYYGSTLATNESFDPVTNSWISLSPMSQKRLNHAAIATDDGKVVILGGDSYFGFLASVEEYSPATNSWTSGTSLPEPRRLLAAAILDGRIYVLGGVVNGNWTPVNTVLVSGSNQADNTPPAAAPIQSPPANGAGWNDADVTVTWNWADEAGGSGIDPANCTTTSTSTSQGEFQLTATCKDLSGNLGSASFSVKVDKTPPTIGYSGNAGTYTVDQTVNITCLATDDLSGVTSHTCQNISRPAYSFPPGANIFSATAQDAAGNVGSGSTAFVVQVSSGSLSALVQNIVSQPAVASSMQTKLTAAGAAAARDNTNAKAGAIRAFINQVEAQTGKAVTPEQAAILIQLARTL